MDSEDRGLAAWDDTELQGLLGRHVALDYQSAGPDGQDVFSMNGVLIAVTPHALHIQGLGAKHAAVIHRNMIRYLCLTVPTGGAR